MIQLIGSFATAIQGLSSGCRWSPRSHGAAEWSSSFDIENWRSFGRRLFRRLGGELAGPLRGALIDDAANAPVGTEASLVVDTARA